MKTILFLLLFMTVAFNAQAVVLFSDNFDLGAKADWGNEVGSWSDAGGVYSASIPSSVPLTYSSVTTLPALTDFQVDVDINDLSDGGIFLRSTNNNNGVLLVTGGFSKSFNGLYWHVVQNGSLVGGVLNQGAYPGLQLSDSHITVTAIGNTYSAYVNGALSPLTTLTDNTFTSGKVALYDFSSQTFDNFSISEIERTNTAIPEPTTLFLLGSGILLSFTRKRF